MMLIELVAPTIETVVNQVIKLDPDASKALLPLDGKVIKFELTDVKQSLYFVIDEERILVKATVDEETNTNAELQGKTLAFFNLIQSEEQTPLFKGDVIFSGEIKTAQKFQNFFESLDIDWEEHLSQYTGDIVAHELFKAGKSFHHWALDTFDTAKQNLSEYLRFEANATPASIELENFYDQVADLKSDVDRLEQRINRMISKKLVADE